MADKPKLSVFTKTDEPPPDPVKPRGIGLRQSEWARWDEIANELGMKPHALALWALRDFMRRWDAGEIETRTGRMLK